MPMSDSLLTDWLHQAQALNKTLNQHIIGQQQANEHILTALFARGHVLLEGPVGVGKTTLLKALAKGLGGHYQRIEGSIDLMPQDLLYYTYLDQSGKPKVDPGPLLSHGEQLATFFFNEINRARPHVHALMLRVMAEREVFAFNQVYRFPHLAVFADRNQVEKDETFELPVAARDRFMFEIGLATPEAETHLDDLMFNTRYHDTEQLLASVEQGLIDHQRLNQIAATIQEHIHVSPALRRYGLALWEALNQPGSLPLNNRPDDDFLIQGPSPRGMSFLIRAAKVHAWLKGRGAVWPEDIKAIAVPVLAHRLVLNPIYAYQADSLGKTFINDIFDFIPVP
ncbi:MAG: MoxR family ATPase [Methylococcales bacterium]|nr:MoxR family ATPase [Methylococcales bacterium]